MHCLRTKEEGKTSGKGKTKDAMFTLCESESIDQMLGDNQTPEELVMTATGCQVQSTLFLKLAYLLSLLLSCNKTYLPFTKLRFVTYLTITRIWQL